MKTLLSISLVRSPVRPAAAARLAALSMAAAGLAVFGGAAGAAGKPHEHGVVKVDVAVDGGMLTVGVEMPMDSLLGFERAPRNDAERKAATEALVKMRDGAALIKPIAAAQCKLDKAEVEAPVLEAPPKPAAGAKPAAQDEHADVDATYTFQCAQPAQLKAVDLHFFDAFRRVQRVEVQAVFPGGQGKTVLRRPARQVKLAK